MDFERFLPLLIIFIVWRLSERMRKKQNQLKSSRSDKVIMQPDISSLTDSKAEMPSPSVDLADSDSHIVTSEIMNNSPVSVETTLEKTTISPKKNALRRAVVWSEILAPPVSLRD